LWQKDFFVFPSRSFTPFPRAAKKNCEAGHGLPGLNIRQQNRGFQLEITIMRGCFYRGLKKTKAKN
jgi:hypothetical protein